MNLVEFLFALTAVFGSTFTILAWQIMVYRWENSKEEGESEESIISNLS